MEIEANTNCGDTACAIACLVAHDNRVKPTEIRLQWFWLNVRYGYRRYVALRR